MLTKPLLMALVTASAFFAAGCGSSDDLSFAPPTAPALQTQAPNSQRLLLLQQHEAVLLQNQAERATLVPAVAVPQQAELAALHTQRAQQLGADRSRLEASFGSPAIRFALQEEIDSINAQIQSLENAKAKAREGYEAALQRIRQNPLLFPENIYGRILQQDLDAELARLEKEENALEARRSFLQAELNNPGG
jgi:hypothetical protein